ncbi:MAG: methionine--tRNA ligase [Pseudomonadota bacterium]
MTAAYITTPIYYVNDKPHIGHAYTTLACDTLARFWRLQGKDVKFLTGTDEHGQKVEKAAAVAGVSPQNFVDDVSQTFRHLIEKIDVTNNDFIRTTEPRHIKAAQALWTRLIDNGSIYLGEYAGWYAVRDEAFYAESELVNGNAPTGADVEWLIEPSYFFKLSAYQDQLLAYYKAHPDFIAPESRRNEVIRFVEGGLHDLSVSRTSFKWGVPVPGDDKHIMYVWLDALTNYMTALGYPDEQTPDFKTFWPEAVHVVGKDILRFHAVYWPAFLMAADLPLPRQVFAHGWWTNEGVKISKSLGNTIDPIELIDTFGSDAVRYFLMREISFGQDGDFSRQALISRINSDLANAYGNLVQRVLSFIYKNADAIVPTPGELTAEDLMFLNLPKQFLPTIDEMQINRYAEGVWALIAKANQYVDEHKPWGLKKTDPERMSTVLYVLADFIRQIAILTQPLVPLASAKILNQLSVPEPDRLFSSLNKQLLPNTKLPEPTGVFPRI